jgi:hypothetical protein
MLPCPGQSVRLKKEGSVSEKDDETEKTSSLRELALPLFSQLSALEGKLLDAAAQFDQIDFAKETRPDVPLGSEKSCPSERCVRASLIRWLCEAPEARKKIDARGVRLAGACILGRLDLDSVNCEFAISIQRCVVPGGVSLRNAKFDSVDLTGTHISDFDGTWLTVRGSLLLRQGFEAAGKLLLRGVKIGGNLDCEAAKITNPGGEALDLQHASVDASVCLRNGFKTRGSVALYRVKVGGDVDAASAEIAGKRRGQAMTLTSCEIGGMLKIGNGFSSLGQVVLRGGSIGNGILGDGGEFRSTGSPALVFDNLRVMRSVYLRSIEQKETRQKFFASGGVAIFASFIDGNLDLAGAELVAREKAFDASIITVSGSILLRNKFIARGEVALTGASIRGAVVLNGSTLIRLKGGVALTLDGCQIGGPFLLNNKFRARGQVRIFGGTIGGDFSSDDGHFAACGKPAILIEGVKVQRSLLLWAPAGPSSQVQPCVFGGFRLNGATVDGSIEIGARLIAKKRSAFEALHIAVGGSVLIRRSLHARGRVTLAGSSIKGVLDLSGGTFVKLKDEPAILLYSLQVGGSVLMNQGFRAVGQVRMYGGAVGANIEAFGGRFASRRNNGLVIDAVKVQRNLLLRGTADVGEQRAFRTFGGVRLSGSWIDGNLELQGARLCASRGVALDASGLTVGGSAQLRNVCARGQINFINASIKGSFDLSGSLLIQDDSKAAMLVTGTQVGGPILLNERFESRGFVRIYGGTVGNNIEAIGARFQAKASHALTIEDVEIQRNVYLRSGKDSFRAYGGLRLNGSVVKGNLDLTGAHIEPHPSGYRNGKLSVHHVRVQGTAFLRGLAISDELDLTDSSFSTLEDDESSWPVWGDLKLNGLTYGTVFPLNADIRLRWLTLASRVGRTPAKSEGEADFVAQPYEHLIQTMRRLGHDRDARRLAIEKEVAMRRSGAFGSGLKGNLKRFAHWAYGATMRYGYRPQFSLFYGLLLNVILVAAFYAGASDFMLPTKDKALSDWNTKKEVMPPYPSFSPIAYSIDTFVPILNLQQRDNWQVNDHTRTGFVLRMYLWIHSMLGWAITTLTVAGFSGLVRKS